MLSVTKHFLLWYHSFFPCYIPDSSDKKNKWRLKIMASKISGCSIITLLNGSKMRKNKQTNKNYWEYKILGFIWCVKLDHHRECLTLVGLVFLIISVQIFIFFAHLKLYKWIVMRALLTFSEMQMKFKGSYIQNRLQDHNLPHHLWITSS